MQTNNTRNPLFCIPHRMVDSNRSSDIPGDVVSPKTIIANYGANLIQTSLLESFIFATSYMRAHKDLHEDDNEFDDEGSGAEVKDNRVKALMTSSPEALENIITLVKSRGKVDNIYDETSGPEEDNETNCHHKRQCHKRPPVKVKKTSSIRKSTRGPIIIDSNTGSEESGQDVYSPPKAVIESVSLTNHNDSDDSNASGFLVVKGALHFNNTLPIISTSHVKSPRLNKSGANALELNLVDYARVDLHQSTKPGSKAMQSNALEIDLDSPKRKRVKLNIGTIASPPRSCLLFIVCML